MPLMIPTGVICGLFDTYRKLVDAFTWHTFYDKKCIFLKLLSSSLFKFIMVFFNSLCTQLIRELF